MAEMSVQTVKPQKGGTIKKKPVSSKSKPDLSQSIDSPVKRVLYLQRTIGNRAVTRLIQSGVLQAKLKIGSPNDIYEKEADRVADQVMTMPDLAIRRQPNDEEKEKIQPKPFAEQIKPYIQRRTEDNSSGQNKKLINEKTKWTSLLNTLLKGKMSKELSEEIKRRQRLIHLFKNSRKRLTKNLFSELINWLFHEWKQYEFLVMEIRKALKESEKSLGGYSYAATGKTYQSQKYAKETGAKKIPFNKGGYKATFQGADILFFGGHFWPKHGILKWGKQELLVFGSWRLYQAPRVKLIIATSCNVLDARRIWDEIFPNALVIGYKFIAPSHNRGFFGKFISTLPKDLYLGDPSGHESVISSWKTYLRKNIKVACNKKVKCANGAGYINPKGGGEYYNAYRDKFYYLK